MGAKIVVEGLEPLEKLETLHLSLNFNNLNDYGGIEAAKGVEKISKRLKTLYFDLSSNEFYDQTALEIAKIIKSAAANVKGDVEFIFLSTAIKQNGQKQIEDLFSDQKNLKLTINYSKKDEEIDLFESKEDDRRQQQKQEEKAKKNENSTK